MFKNRSQLSEADMKVGREVIAHRRTFRADDRLSRAVSAISRANGHLGDALEDIDRYHAPQECAAKVAQGYDKRVREALKDQGYTMASYLLALDSQVGAKQAYFMGWLPDVTDSEFFDYREKRNLLDTRQIVFDLAVVDWETGEVVVDKGQSWTFDCRQVLADRLQSLVDSQQDDEPASVQCAARARYALRQIERTASRVVWVGTREAVR